jgi:putative membrane protein
MGENRENEWGFHAFIRGIILFGFTMFFLSLVLSGNIKFYIAPTMMPFVYFALVIFMLLSIVQIMRSTPRGQEEEIECDCGTNHQMTGPRWKKVLIYSIFVLPLLMGFMFPDKTLDSSVAAKRGVQLGAGIYSKPATDQLQNDTESISGDEASSTARADEYLAELDKKEQEDQNIEHYTVEDTYSNDGFSDFYEKLAKDLTEQDLIVVEDETFLDIMTVMDLYLDDFLGKKVQIMGFVYREPGLEQDEMVVARFSMTCCTADSAVYGLLINGEKTRDYENDTWVRVTGTIDQREFNGWNIPLIQVEQVEEVDEPENPYVYQSFN